MSALRSFRPTNNSSLLAAHVLQVGCDDYDISDAVAMAIGIIIGIVVGSVVLCVGGVIACVMCCKKQPSSLGTKSAEMKNAPTVTVEAQVVGASDM